MQTPVAWMWPTLRSPLLLCSITQIEPFVSMSILPEPSVLPCVALVSSSVHVASPSVKALNVICVAVEVWKIAMLWPARTSLNV